MIGLGNNVGLGLENYNAQGRFTKFELGNGMTGFARVRFRCDRGWSKPGWFLSACLD